MPADIQFETPENVIVSYKPAGLGTRFVAWFLDNILVFVVTFVLFILLACVGLMSATVAESIFRPLDGATDPEKAQQFFLVFIGIGWLVWGLGSFLYFGLSELFLRGQTLGKQVCGIRVVKTEGFSLDGTSILVRNIFRVLDHLPPLWIVPVVNGKAQRLGDLVAGTLVIADESEEISDVRRMLSERSAAESLFRFDEKSLKRLNPDDATAVERILERWPSLDEAQQTALLDQIVGPLAERLQREPPALEERHRFLEDLLSAEYRRQNRSLG